MRIEHYTERVVEVQDGNTFFQAARMDDGYLLLRVVHMRGDGTTELVAQFGARPEALRTLLGAAESLPARVRRAA